MQLYELIFTILVIYLLYKLVFNVVVPVARVSSTVREQMRHMQQEQQTTKPPSSNNYASSAGSSKNAGAPSSDSEYIDFEEIK